MPAAITGAGTGGIIIVIATADERPGGERDNSKGRPTGGLYSFADLIVLPIP